MHRGRWTSIAVTAVTLLGVGACGRKDRMDGAAGGMPMAGAEYRLVFRSTWTPATHPFEYPAAGALTGPHFSGLIGAAVGPSYTLFGDGSTPTPGLERLSEEGRHSPLDEEIRAAIAAGTAANLFETGPLRNFADSLVTTVRLDSAHSVLSFVTMVAPSPDWFTGARIELMENGQWVSSRTLNLNAWDSGGDDGTTYKAADRDNDPKKPTSGAMTRHFVTNGAVVPVATVTITRM